MSRKPRVGVTIEVSDRLMPQVDERLREFFEHANATLLYLPRSSSQTYWTEVYPLLDAVVLMGGPDVDPARYGAAPHETTKTGSYVNYDETEIRLAEAALADGKPIVGLCRGCQVLNVAAGGTLVQDVPSTGTTLEHAKDWPTVLETPPGSRHDVRVDPNSRLGALLGPEPLVVNSYHHQSIDTTGPNMRAVAWAPDGIVEAIEGTGEGFAIGMQWHNEFHLRDGERFVRPMDALLDGARRRSRE